MNTLSKTSCFGIQCKSAKEKSVITVLIGIQLSRAKVTKYIQGDERLWLKSIIILKPSQSSAPFEKCYLSVSRSIKWGKNHI